MALTIGAVIPTRYHPTQLDRLLDVCEADNVRVALMASERFDHQIYRMWNVGRLQLGLLGCQYIAILNDDIAILPGTLPLLAEALEAHPEYGVVYPVHGPLVDGLRPGELIATEGTWGSGGMTGFCFMLNDALPLPHFDTAFHWWYGDDAFEADVRRAGYLVGRYTGVPVEHTPNGSAGRDWARLAPLVEEDRARWGRRLMALTVIHPPMEYVNTPDARECWMPDWWGPWDCPGCGTRLACLNDYGSGSNHYWALRCTSCGRGYSKSTYRFGDYDGSVLS